MKESLKIVFGDVHLKTYLLLINIHICKTQEN